MKLKDRPWENEERAKALGELDKYPAYEVEIYCTVPAPPEGKKAGTRRRITKGVLALYERYEDFIEMIEANTGSSGSWLFNALLRERYKNEDGSNKSLKEMYREFRKETLGDQHEEWTT